MIALALVVLATHASGVDRTYRCTPASGPFSGKPTLGIHGSPQTRRFAPFLQLSSREPLGTNPGDLGVAAFRIDGASSTLTYDKQLCRPVTVRPAFGTRGLVENNVYSSTFLGSFIGQCATPPAVLIRARVALAGGRPASAQVVVVSATGQRPIAFFAWARHRIAVWLADRTCEVRAYPY